MPERFRYCPWCAAPVQRVERDGLQRLACTQCDFVHWENPVPVVAAIVEHEGKIVLARNALWPPGMFALITGFMERSDDSPQSAVLREVAEELNLEGEVVSFVGHYRFHRMNQIIMAFHVRARGDIRLDPELTEYRLQAPDTLRPWGGATGDALRDWMLASGLEPLPYDFEPLTHIAGYQRITRELAAGGIPEPVQFLALALAHVSVVIVLGDGTPQQRQAAESVGLQFQTLDTDLTEAADTAWLQLDARLKDLDEQRTYVCATDEATAIALTLECAHGQNAISG